MNSQDATETQDSRQVSETEHQPANRSVGRLIRQLTIEVTSLVQNEAALARAEISQKITKVVSAVASIAVAGVLCLVGLIGLMDAAIYGLGTVWPLWLSALVIGGAITIVGLIALAMGMATLRATSLSLDHTSEELRKDSALAQEQVQ